MHSWFKLSGQVSTINYFQLENFFKHELLSFEIICLLIQWLRTMRIHLKLRRVNICGCLWTFLRVDIYCFTKNIQSVDICTYFWMFVAILMMFADICGNLIFDAQYSDYNCNYLNYTIFKTSKTDLTSKYMYG